MRKHFVCFALALFTASPALADPNFESLKNHAQRLDSLPGFLLRFVGDCKDPSERRSCEENVRVARRGFEGKLLMVTLSEGTLEIVRAQALGDHYRILVTPFIDGGGFALTHGAPNRQDASGRPLINFIVLEGPLPPGGEFEFQGPFRTGSVEMEILFKPEGTWRLKRKGEAGFYEGVKARFVGLRLVNPRTGSEIATKMLSGA